MASYIGVAATRPNGKREFYYRCNGAHSPAIYGARRRCPAKAVRGDLLEQQVWSDVESFLRDPEPVIRQLHAKLASEAQGCDQTPKQVVRLEGLLAQKATERSRVVALYRRGRLTEADLDAVFLRRQTPDASGGIHANQALSRQSRNVLFAAK